MENTTETKPKTTREQVAVYVTNDLSGIVAFVNMVRSNPDILNALIDVIHQRVTADEEGKTVQPELPLDHG